MKKILPNTKGFTLVELLVVVAIIAILAVIGLVIFTGTQKTARDSRRKSDIDAIATAMEVKYGTITAGRYEPLATNMFSSGVIPLDPANTNPGVAPDSTCPGVCKYCVREGGAAQIGAACAILTAPVVGGAPSGGSTNTNWVVCANLEAAPSGQPTFYCRGNQQ